MTTIEKGHSTYHLGSAAFDICKSYAVSLMITLSERELAAVKEDVLEKYSQFVR